MCATQESTKVETVNKKDENFEINKDIVLEKIALSMIDGGAMSYLRMKIFINFLQGYLNGI